MPVALPQLVPPPAPPAELVPRTSCAARHALSNTDTMLAARGVPQLVAFLNCAAKGRGGEGVGGQPPVLRLLHAQQQTKPASARG